MIKEIVPVKLRDHLIPFFFEEMDGLTASYDGQKAKMVKLLPSSSLANYLYSHIGYEIKNNGKPNDNFILYLSVFNHNSMTATGTIYVDSKGVKNELQLPIDKVRDINNLLEDIFRTSIVNFIEGAKIGGKNVRFGINAFMEKYNLEEYGFETESIRKMYYEQRKKKALSRFQIRSSNKILGFF